MVSQTQSACRRGTLPGVPGHARHEDRPGRMAEPGGQLVSLVSALMSRLPVLVCAGHEDWPGPVAELGGKQLPMQRATAQQPAAGSWPPSPVPSLLMLLTPSLLHFLFPSPVLLLLLPAPPSLAALAAAAAGAAAGRASHAGLAGAHAAQRGHAARQGKPAVACCAVLWHAALCCGTAAGQLGIKSMPVANRAMPLFRARCC